MKTSKVLFAVILLFTVLLSCSTDDAAMEDTTSENEAENDPDTNESEEESLTYNVGDTGPAGGLVIYDKGEVTDGWQYIEVGPEDIGSNIQWGCLTSEVAEAQNIEIGSGLMNSEAIAAYHDSLTDYTGNPEQCNENNNGTVAAKIALSYDFGGFDDWHLPSQEEAVLFYTALHINGLGDFNENNLYWTSTENSLDAIAVAAISVDPDISSSDQQWGWIGKQWDEGEGMLLRPVRYF